MILTRFNSVLYLHEQVSGHRQHDVTLCISQCILQTIGRARPVFHSALHCACALVNVALL